MAGDILCTIMPMFLIWGLIRSVVERCLISVLMALSLSATGAGVLKIIYSKTFDRTSPDVFREMMPVFLWVRMEEVLLVVASSAPLIKSPVIHILHRLGLPRFQHTIGQLNSFHSSRFEATGHWYNLSNRRESDGKLAGRRGMETEERPEAGKQTPPAASMLSATECGTLHSAISEGGSSNDIEHGASNIKSANSNGGPDSV